MWKSYASCEHDPDHTMHNTWSNRRHKGKSSLWCDSYKHLASLILRKRRIGHDWSKDFLGKSCCLQSSTNTTHSYIEGRQSFEGFTYSYGGVANDLKHIYILIEWSPIIRRIYMIIYSWRVVANHSKDMYIFIEGSPNIRRVYIIIYSYREVANPSKDKYILEEGSPNIRRILLRRIHPA